MFVEREVSQVNWTVGAEVHGGKPQYVAVAEY